MNTDQHQKLEHREHTGHTVLIFEQLVHRGFMVLDRERKVLTFNREVVAKFPAIRKSRMEEFKWLLG